MKTRHEILKTVTEIVAGIGGPFDGDPANIPMFDGGVDLSSMGFLDVVLTVEDRLGVSIRDKDIGDDALETVGAFAAFVADHVEGRAS